MAARGFKRIEIPSFSSYCFHFNFGSPTPGELGTMLDDLGLVPVCLNYDTGGHDAWDAVTITLDGVDVMTAPKKNFQFTFPNCYAHLLGKFNAKYNYWMNYHWRVFKANGPTATLTVSDWAGEEKPGGPGGQELMFNFIEIQPYIGD